MTAGSHAPVTSRPARELVREAAITNGVCIRPVVTRVVDTFTGAVQLVPIACGSTREAQCPPCADKARRLRMHQCREGWHLDTEPPEPPPTPDDDGPEDDDAPDDDSNTEDERVRRVRSTRRRHDVAELPRLPVEDRTLGRVFTAPDGTRWQPSTFVTLTLPSYGRVHSDGTPVDPDSYDYRRAALDAMHFPKLIDRFWQNLRRSVGWKVQYFASIEGQRRLAPHLHAAIRGTLRVGDTSARQLVRQVAAATYEHLWWPAHTTPTYTEQLPVWDPNQDAYVDPDTGRPLPTWGQALDTLENDPEARPAHVVRFGSQVDVVGVTPGPKGDRLIGYLTKYLAKDIAGDYGNDDNRTARRLAHIARLHQEVRRLPCSPKCANWLRYGIAPPTPPPKASNPAPAPTKHTAAKTSASAAAASSSPAAGPAKPSPVTAPTGPKSSARPSKPPASTPTTTRSSPSTAKTAATAGSTSHPVNSRPPTTSSSSPGPSKPAADGDTNTTRHEPAPAPPSRVLSATRQRREADHDH